MDKKFRDKINSFLEEDDSSLSTGYSYFHKSDTLKNQSNGKSQNYFDFVIASCILLGFALWLSSLIYLVQIATSDYFLKSETVISWCDEEEAWCNIDNFKDTNGHVYYISNNPKCFSVKIPSDVAVINLNTNSKDIINVNFGPGIKKVCSGDYLTYYHNFPTSTPSPTYTPTPIP